MKRLLQKCRAGYQRGQSQHGASLIELIISISVTAIISVVIAQTLTSGVEIYDYVNKRKNAMQSTRMAILRITREVRAIANKDSMLIATNDSLAFYSLDGQQVTIAKSGDNLNLNGKLLASKVDAFVFTYFNDQGSQITAPVTNLYNIHQIKFELTTGIEGQEIYLFNEVKPRNF